MFLLLRLNNTFICSKRLYNYGKWKIHIIRINEGSQRYSRNRGLQELYRWGFLSNGRLSKHSRLFIKSVVLLWQLPLPGDSNSSLFYSTYNMKCRSVAKNPCCQKKLYTEDPRKLHLHGSNGRIAAWFQRYFPSI